MSQNKGKDGTMEIVISIVLMIVFLISALYLIELPQ